MNKPLIRRVAKKPKNNNKIQKYVEKIDNYDEEEHLEEQINHFWLFLEIPLYLLMAVFFALAWFLDDGTLKERHGILYVMIFFLLQALIVLVLSYGIVSIGFYVLCIIRQRVIAYKLWEARDQI